MTLPEIATTLRNAKEKIILIYAFNAIGKTRLSVAYKNATKTDDGTHAGVYYNAFSEDIFVWDNDIENSEKNIRLMVSQSSLNKYHALFDENAIRQKLEPYNPTYDFYLNTFDDSEKGIEHITFFVAGDNKTPIKISRGEERIFVWCFFLALFEVDGWADEQSSHFFIDDPVSSLDDHNIFVTVSTLYDLIKTHHDKRKIIITTHHIGLFSILFNWLKRGDTSEKYKGKTKTSLLVKNEDDFELKNEDKDVLLYHLYILRLLKEARDGEIKAFHFALLRQVLENISSFLGVGRIGFVLEKIGYEPANKIPDIVNYLTHKNIYRYEDSILVEYNINMFNEIFDKLVDKYNFVFHSNPASTSTNPHE